jgi:hypothetical protein
VFVLAIRDRISGRKSTLKSAAENKTNGAGLKTKRFDEPRTQTGDT